MSSSSSWGKALLKGSSWQSVGQFLPLIINLALTPYLISEFGKERWGVILFSNAIMLFISALDGGIGQSALRFYSVYIGEGREHKISQLCANAVAALAVLMTVVSGTMIALLPVFMDLGKISDGLRPEASTLMGTLAITYAVAMTRLPFQSVLFAHNRYAVPSLATLTGHIIYISGILLSVTQGWGLYGVAATFAVQQLSSTLIMVIPACSHLHWKHVSPMSKAQWAEFLRFAWRGQATGFINLALLNKDNIAINMALGTAAGAPFAQGSQFAQQLYLMPMNAQAPIQGMLGKWVGERGVKGSIVGFEQLQSVWIKIIAMWCVIGAPAAYFGVKAWIPEFSHAAPITAAILLMGWFFLLATLIARHWLMAAGHPEIIFRYVCWIFGINLALTVATLPFFGPLASLASTVVGNIVALPILEHYVRKVVHPEAKSSLRHVPLLATVSAGLVALGLELLADPIPVTGGLGLLTAAAIASPAAVVYVVLAFGPRLTLTAIRTKNPKLLFGSAMAGPTQSPAPDHAEPVLHTPPKGPS